MSYLSSWILNFGVVPLFLSEAFLFVPMLFFLFALLAFVTFDLETISQLQFFNKSRVLTKIIYSVKTLFVLTPMTISAIGICVAEEVTSKDIILKVGEHREIPFKGEKYSVGDKEIITYKLVSNSHLIIKGKQLGNTELVIWTKAGKKSYNIYVTSRQGEINILALAKSFKDLQVDALVSGKLIITSGELNNLDNYLIYKNILTQHKEHIQSKVTLSKNLRNQIIGDIYKNLFDQNINNFSCKDEGANIVCNYPANTKLSKQVMDFLKKKYRVDFIPYEFFDGTTNYLAKIKIIQIEKLNGEQFDLGLESISGTFDEIFSQGIEGLVRNNQAELANNSLDISTLAEPEQIITIGNKALISIGANIPYKTPSSNGDYATTEWKFAGLQISVELKSVGEKLQLQYSTEISYPGTNDEIRGSKEESTITIPGSGMTRIFQIGFKTIGSVESSLPGLGKIPLLGKLFKSTSDQNNYKKITGIIKLEPYAN